MQSSANRTKMAGHEIHEIVQGPDSLKNIGEITTTTHIQ